MGRATETRTLVREAADKLLAEGLSPNKITVDRIHQAIGQGSRTTINDELKAWRAEQSSMKIAQVPAGLEPMLVRLWASALEQAQTGFEEQRERIEQEQASALALADQLGEQNGQLTRQLAGASQQIAENEAALAAVSSDFKDFKQIAETERAVSATRMAELEEKASASEARATKAIAEAAERIAAWQSEAERREKTLRADFRERSERQEAQLGQVREALERAAAEGRSLEKQLGATQANLEAAERERERLQQQMRELRKELDETGSLLIVEEKKAEEAQKRLHQLEIANSTLEVKLSAREEALAVAEARRTTAEQIYAESRAEVRRLREALEQASRHAPAQEPSGQK